MTSYSETQTINKNSSDDKSNKFAKAIIAIFFPKGSIFLTNESAVSLLRQELIDMFQRCDQHLDKKFINEIESNDCKKVFSSLWEIIVLDHLCNHSQTDIAPHREAGPDWQITIKDKTYHVEATCAQLPESQEKSQIYKVMQQSEKERSTRSDHRLIDEVMSRIATRISEKIKKHSEWMADKDAGYILCLSYGTLPYYTSCDLHHAVSTILPIGPLKIVIDRKNMSTHDKYLSNQTYFNKLNGIKIATNILTDDENAWISAVLLSKVEALLLLNNTKLLLNIPINWPDKENDFVLVYNPKARYPLTEDIFGCRTTITTVTTENELLLTGENIFPTMKDSG